jgi:hypothetical protein
MDAGYSKLPKDVLSRLTEIEETIRKEAEKVKSGVIKIGDVLAEVKDMLSPKWYAYFVLGKLNWTLEVAGGYIRASRVLRKYKALHNIPISVAISLSSENLPDTIREKAAEMADKGYKITSTVVSSLREAAKNGCPLDDLEATRDRIVQTYVPVRVYDCLREEAFHKDIATSKVARIILQDWADARPDPSVSSGRNRRGHPSTVTQKAWHRK